MCRFPEPPLTAGSGLVHAELSPEAFKRAGGPLEILQLWVNLPAHLKFTPPRYQGLQGDAIPIATSTDGKARVSVIAGEWEGVKGPVESLTGHFMSTVSMDAGARIDVDNLKERAVFLYVVSGDIRVNGRDVTQHHLVELDLDGDALAIEASTSARLLFGHGQPINEPVVTHGPFVMNTVDEIRQAIIDYQAGKFGVVPA